MPNLWQPCGPAAQNPQQGSQEQLPECPAPSAPPARAPPAPGGFHLHHVQTSAAAAAAAESSSKRRFDDDSRSSSKPGWPHFESPTKSPTPLVTTCGDGTSTIPTPRRPLPPRQGRTTFTLNLQPCLHSYVSVEGFCVPRRFSLSGTVCLCVCAAACDIQLGKRSRSLALLLYAYDARTMHGPYACASSPQQPSQCIAGSLK